MPSSRGGTDKVTLLATSVSFTIEEITAVTFARRVSEDKMRARSISKSSTWPLSPCFPLVNLSGNIKSSKCTNHAHFGYPGRYTAAGWLSSVRSGRFQPPVTVEVAALASAKSFQLASSMPTEHHEVSSPFPIRHNLYTTLPMYIHLLFSHTAHDTPHAKVKT